MENWAREPAHGCKAWVNVEGVEVPGEAVENCLVPARLVLKHAVRVPFGRSDRAGDGLF